MEAAGPLPAELLTPAIRFDDGRKVHLTSVVILSLSAIGLKQNELAGCIFQFWKAEAVANFEWSYVRSRHSGSPFAFFKVILLMIQTDDNSNFLACAVHSAMCCCTRIVLVWIDA